MGTNKLLTKSAFKGDISIGFHVNEGDDVEITHDRVKYLILDNSYEKWHNPVIYIGLACTKDLYNKIIDNEKNATFNLNLKIYNAKTKIPIKRNSNINGNFFYTVSTNNPNFYEDLARDKNGSNVYIQLTVALYKMEGANTLRTPVNEIIKTDTSTYLHKLLSGMKYAMSELDNNEELETMICSPKSTIVSSIADVARDFPFYSTPTRLFADFDKLYLLKTDGETIFAA